jgi:ABC-type polysaccharide/polyol phosphate export permease
VQRIISQLHQWAARIFLAGLLLQFYLASAPLFGAGSFQPHRMLGAALAALVFLFPVLALAGRLGRQLVGLSILLAVLAIVQVMLPSLRGSLPWLAALHPVNALALMGLSARLARNGRAAAPSLTEQSVA